MRLGIFGGTFDPIHLGHLVLAEQSRERVRLDRVLFVPAAQPPHKADRQITAARHRQQMVELAVAGHPAFEVSAIEIDRPGLSYTVDTLASLHEQHPGDDLFLLIGSDSLIDLPQWYQPKRIAQLATIVVVTRSGYESSDELSLLRGVLSDEQVSRIAEHRIEIPPIGISSRDLRRRVATGQSIRYLVPRPVECYVETHGLYRDR
jgi:nicotinate-nucleotide adenylyltransferase